MPHPAMGTLVVPFNAISIIRVSSVLLMHQHASLTSLMPLLCSAGQRRGGQEFCTLLRAALQPRVRILTAACSTAVNDSI